MFGMGLQEILLIAVIAIVVIGPDQLPAVARTIGRMMAQFKRASNDLRHAVTDEMQQHEELNEFKEFSRELDGGVRDIGAGAKAYIDREVERGERELDALEHDAIGDASDAAEVAAVTPTEHMPTLGADSEDSAGASEADQVVAATTAGGSSAGDAAGAASPTGHKESA